MKNGGVMVSNKQKKANIAYSSEYLDYTNQFHYVISDEYFKEIETIELSQDFSVKVIHYQDSSRKTLPHQVECNLCQLINTKGEIVFSTMNYADDGAFFDLIEHSNGRKYLVFRKELYGYCVLDLNTMTDYQYYPEESFRGGETFIWTGTHYNKNTNLLVAEGCYWACPFELFVVDFSEPASVPYPEFRLCEYLGDDDFGYMEFKCWDDHDHLVFKYFDNKAGQYVDKIIEKDACLSILKS